MHSHGAVREAGPKPHAGTSAPSGADPDRLMCREEPRPTPRETGVKPGVEKTLVPISRISSKIEVLFGIYLSFPLAGSKFVLLMVVCVTRRFDDLD